MQKIKEKLSTLIEIMGKANVSPGLLYGKHVPERVPVTLKKGAGAGFPDGIRRSNGFTLVELMITLALCALVVSLTIVNVGFLHRGLVRSEVDKLYATCMYLQQCALTTGQEHELLFDQTENSYNFAGKTEKLRNPVVFGFIPGVKPNEEQINLISLGSIGTRSGNHQETT